MFELSSYLRSIVLPPNFVSVPSTEEGFVSLHQQTGLYAEEDPAPQTSENWRSKAIRRKLSKLKELVLFVGGLPQDLDKTDYVKRISLYTNKREDACIGPIFPDQGCLFISFTSGMAAANMVKTLHERKIFGRSPTLIFLPFISVPTGSPTTTYDPLLIFINSKSGGGQGKQLVDMMRGILNRNQVYLLDLGGPMPGLYAFRKLPRFRILVCGGDGTVGWVLSALEQMQRNIQCKSPPIAVLPLGTGNDLARVLGFGSGWSGEGITNILNQVQEAHPVKMDRWQILFDSSPLPNKKPAKIAEEDHEEFHSPDPENSTPIVNGHRKLQRTLKYNPQRSRVNIIMGVGDDAVWQTADKFKSPEEEKPALELRNSLSKQNSKGDNPSSRLKVSKKNSKTEYPVPRKRDSAIETLASNVLDNFVIPLDTEHAEEVSVRNEAKMSNFSDEIGKKSDTDDSNVENTSPETETPQDSESKPTWERAVDESVAGSEFKSSGEGTEQFETESEFKPSGEGSRKFVAGDTNIIDLATIESEVPLKKNEDSVQDVQRKSVHRKLQILSSSDILDSRNTVFGQRQISQLSKCESIDSEEESENTEKNETVPDDLILRQGAVDDFVNDILQSELPDIINDKQKLITLLTCDDAQSELDKMIKKSKEQETKAEELKAENSEATKNGDEKNSQEIVKTAAAENYVDAYSGEGSNSNVRNRAQTSAAADDGQRFFGPRKKMSLPLITTGQTYRPPENGLSGIAEESTAEPTTKVIGPNNAIFQRSISEICNEEPAKAAAGPKVVTMNNYFGLGIDAEMSLYFHLAREENPEKFSSRFHNKAVYLKAILKKMTSRTMQLNNIIDIVVDGKEIIDFPSVKGLILLNIPSWGAGGNAWGSSTSRRFQTPAIGDGLLEVVGISGVAHMSHIYSGIRGGFRIAQGECIRLRLHSEVAVQVDGEPWMQPPGQIIVTVSHLQAMMLKRLKKKAR